MKTTKRKTTPKNTTPQVGLSFVPIHGFTPKPDDGSNDVSLAHIQKLLLANYPTFTIGDFRSLSANLGLEISELLLAEKKFERWTAQLVKENRVRKVEGCFSVPVFEVMTN